MEENEKIEITKMGEKTETETTKRERKIKEDWRDILGISSDTEPEVKMIRRIAELHRNKLAKRLDELEKNAMNGDIPKIQEEEKYLKELVKKYPNPKFSEVIDKLTQFRNYFEVKDERTQIDRAEQYGILKCLDSIERILGKETLGKSTKEKIQRQSSVTMTEK